MFRVTEFSTIDVGNGGHMSVRRATVSPRLIELVRRDLHEADHVTVISMILANDLSGPSVSPGHPEGQVIGL